MAATGEMSASPAMALVFRWFIPFLTGTFGLFLPAGLQLTLFTTAIFTVSQSYLFRQPGFRKYFGMHPLPKKPEPPKAVLDIQAKYKDGAAPSQKPKWGLEAVKHNVMTAYKELNQQKARMEAEFGPQKATGRLSEAEKKRAKAYEEERQRELAKQKFQASKDSKRRGKPE